MGFDIVYGPSARAVANSGTLAGRGQYNLQQQQIRQRDRMQRRSIEAAAASREDVQRFQAEQGDLSRSFQGEQRELQEQRIRERQEREAELQERGFELRITKQQELENAKLNQSVQWVRDQVSDGRWTEKEGQLAIDQIELKRLGLDRLPVPKQPSPWGEGKEPGQTWVENGGVMTRDANGNVKSLVKPPQFSIKDISDMTAQVRESMTVWGEGDQPDRLPDPIEVQEEVMRRLQAYLAINNMIIGGAAGGPQGAPPEQGLGQPQAVQEQPSIQGTMIEEDGDPISRVASDLVNQSLPGQRVGIKKKNTPQQMSPNDIANLIPKAIKTGDPEDKAASINFLRDAVETGTIKPVQAVRTVLNSLESSAKDFYKSEFGKEAEAGAWMDMLWDELGMNPGGLSGMIADNPTYTQVKDYIKNAARFSDKEAERYIYEKLLSFEHVPAMLRKLEKHVGDIDSKLAIQRSESRRKKSIKRIRGK